MERALGISTHAHLVSPGPAEKPALRLDDPGQAKGQQDIPRRSRAQTREKGPNSESHCPEARDRTPALHAQLSPDVCAFLSSARELKQVWILKSLKAAILFTIFLLQGHTLERPERCRLTYHQETQSHSGSAQSFSAPDSTALYQVLQKIRLLKNHNHIPFHT